MNIIRKTYWNYAENLTIKKAEVDSFILCDRWDVPCTTILNTKVLKKGVAYTCTQVFTVFLNFSYYNLWMLLMPSSNGFQCRSKFSAR